MPGPSGLKHLVFVNEKKLTEIYKFESEGGIMKKLILSILFVTLLTGCVKKEVIELTNPPEYSPCRLLLENDLLDFAKDGRLKGIQVALDTTREDVEEAYGKPDHLQTEHGNPVLKYGNCYFYIWEDRIGVIDVSIPYSVKDVKDIMGQPDYEGESDAGFDEYVLGYQASDYYLYFKYLNEEATSGVIRFKKS